MKITDVTLTLFGWYGIKPTSYGNHTGSFGGDSKLGLLEIVTDEDVVGHAFLGSARKPADVDADGLIRFLKPLLLGKNPLDREALNRALWQRSRNASIRSVGAVDVALWDIAGKMAGMPLHRLMGSFRDRIPAYASSEVLESPEAYIEQALNFKSKNWAAYKIHPSQKWEEDIKLCVAVRKAVGDDYKLMLDSTWGYDFPRALRVGLAIQEMNYYWYEDPLAETDVYNYQKLKQHLHIPIMATEYPKAGLGMYAQWLEAKATDYLRGDVAVKGGITTLLKAAHLAEAFGMNFELHHGGNSLNNVANLHVTMAIRNTELFEVLLPDEVQKYGLLEDIVVDKDGMVHAPTEPGLGAKIDFDLISRNKLAVLR